MSITAEHTSAAGRGGRRRAPGIGPPGHRDQRSGSLPTFFRLLDHFVPPTLRRRRDHWRRARLLAGTSLVLAIVMVLLLVRRVAFDEPHVPTLVMMVIGTATLIATPFLLRSTASYSLAGWSLVLVGVALMSAGAYQNGGFASLAVYWYPALPLLASFMVGPRLALVTSLLLIADLIGMYLLHTAGHAFPRRVTVAQYEEFFIVGASLAVAFSAVLGGLYETAWKRAELALDTSEQRYSLAVHGARDVLWDWDPRGPTLYLSPRLMEVLELPDDGPQTPEELGALLHPDDVAVAEAALRACFDGTEDLIDLEVRLRTSRMTWRWFDCRGQTVRRTDGTVARLAGSLRDITRSKDVERELASKVGELERAGRALAQFTWATSHDLREPLRAVTSFSQLLARRTGDLLDESQRAYLQIIVDGAHRMEALIRDLHVHSRLAQAQDPPVPTCLGGALDAALDALAEPIASSSAVILRSEMPAVWCVPSQLAQIFEQLVSNAIKFQGELTPVIAIQALVEQNMVHVSVEDNGIGIAPEHVARVFDLFQRLHSRERYPGTGSGLAVCRNIIERSGGRIWVESEPGSGSTFHFTLRSA